MSPQLEDKAVVLFQGDSITDAGRNRKEPDSMGSGYAMMAAAWFHALYPEKAVCFLNRGISGNCARDLEERWQADCLDIQPTWVSILVGINEIWRRYDNNDPTSTQDYEATYRSLLERVKSASHARIILCEPFVLPINAACEAWREDLNPKIDVVRRLAREFNTLLVPLDGIFAQASLQREPAFWAADGVHPSNAGHARIAQAWLRTLKAL